MTALSDLQASNAAITAAVNSAITQLQALAAKLASSTNADDPDVEAVATSLNTLATNLQSAVTASAGP